MLHYPRILLKMMFLTPRKKHRTSIHYYWGPIKTFFQAKLGFEFPKQLDDFTSPLKTVTETFRTKAIHECGYRKKSGMEALINEVTFYSMVSSLMNHVQSTFWLCLYFHSISGVSVSGNIG